MSDCFIKDFLKKVEREDNQRIASCKSAIKKEQSKLVETTDKIIGNTYVYKLTGSFRPIVGATEYVRLEPQNVFQVTGEIKRPNISTHTDYVCIRLGNPSPSFLFDAHSFRLFLADKTIVLKQ